MSKCLPMVVVRVQVYQMPLPSPTHLGTRGGMRQTGIGDAHSALFQPGQSVTMRRDPPYIVFLSPLQADPMSLVVCLADRASNTLQEQRHGSRRLQVDGAEYPPAAPHATAARATKQ